MLIELLSQDEKDLFYDYTAVNTASYRTVNSRASVKNLLQEWDNQKSKYLWNVLQHNFILSKEIQMNELVEETEAKITSIFNWGGPGRKFLNSFNRFVDWYVYTWGVAYGLWENDRHGEYWRTTEAVKIYSNISKLMTVETLRKNVYSGGMVKLPLVREDGTPDTKTIVLEKGCKVSKFLQKMFSKFRDHFPECSDEDFERFRLAHSQALNEKVFTGTLSLSIHPLDFISASDNNCGWSSCMSWLDDGEYHRGVVEMMNSPAVICAYLEDKNSKFWPVDNRTWTNKKWREFFIVDKNFITGIKGYPYWNQDLEKVVVTWLRELAIEAGLPQTPYSDVVVYQPHHLFDIPEIDSSIYIDFSTASGAMYNDFFDNHEYVGAFAPEYYDNMTYYYKYNGRATCMWCGEVYEYGDAFDNEGMTSCQNCAGSSYHCDECGASISDDDGYEVDGEYVCPDCYWDLEQCAYSGERHLSCCLTRIYLCSKEHNVLFPSEYNSASIYNDYSNYSELLGCPIYMVKIKYSRWGNTDYGYAVMIEDLIANSNQEICDWFNIDLDSDEFAETQAILTPDWIKAQKDYRTVTIEDQI